ncbi:hypothetical protein KM043_006502 [Ampulex compressa]|nr:hypothetical protein KM043_006502 [Ampulex compressa]
MRKVFDYQGPLDPRGAKGILPNQENGERRARRRYKGSITARFEAYGIEEKRSRAFIYELFADSRFTRNAGWEGWRKESGERRKMAGSDEDGGRQGSSRGGRRVTQ